MNRRENVVDLVKAAFVVLLVKVMASSSLLIPWNSFADNLCIIFAICIMLAKLFGLTMRLDRLMVLGVVAVLALYTCVSMKLYNLLVTVVAVCLLIDEDLEEYIPLMLKIQAYFLIAHVAVSGLMSLTGSADRFWFTADDRLRFNGGFSHPNVLSCYILSCTMMFAWTRFRRLTSGEFGWMVCITIVSFLMSRSRTGLLLNLFLLLIIFLTQKSHHRLEKAISAVLPLLFPVCAAVIFLAQKRFVSGSSAAMFLNELLNSRIKLAAYAYHRSGVSWLPRYLDYAQSGRVSWTPEWNLNTFTFDCLYSFLFVQMGMIWIGIITVLIFVACRRFDFRNKVFLLFWVLFGIVEVHGLNCFMFFPLLLLSMLLSKKGDEHHPSRHD